MTTVYIGLGANLGDRGQALEQALQRLHASEGVQVQAVSSLYSSAPVDATGPDYLNAVARIDTSLEPQAFLELLQALELAAGRERPYRNAPRTLDLDVLLWGQSQLNTPTLTVPHPRMYERAFVLRPLQELAPECVSAAHLAAVAHQRLQAMEPPTWAQLDPSATR